MSNCMRVVYKVKRNELYHYGVLGMKWGVRRDEYLKRHTIPRGTKMYRVTIDSNESTKGNKYVTYLPPDRDMYRGSYANGIRQQYGKDKNTPLYENTYTLKEDLNIPSREEYKKVLTKVLDKNDGKHKAEVLRRYAEDAALDLADSMADEGIDSLTISEESKKYVGRFIERNKDLNVNDPYFFHYAINYGKMKDKTLKDEVIQELKNKGYNAMVDEASVGGKELGFRREGVDPLIIFDGNNSLTKNDTRSISTKEQSEATKRYDEWYDYADRSEKDELLTKLGMNKW